MPARGDLVWLHINPQSGHEQAGRRPAVVVSPEAYNRVVGLALVCPITSRVKGYPFEVRLPEDSGVSGVILSDQLESLDWRAREAEPIGAVSAEVMSEVVARIVPLIQPSPARG